MSKRKPELLAPVGNTESLYAALNAGADAVFLGLQEFNARGRASNFSRPMLRLAVKRAHEKNVKVYLTLNILIKNRELDQLLDVLGFLAAIEVDAIIIQDWGVYYLSKKYFPSLVLHASTQMGNHNSAGVNFGDAKGIRRTVLARELTMPELELLSKRSKGELEVFIHGALCYSFSGMCLYSSYSGGQGANRGMCKQSCRRSYRDGDEENVLFSLKDNQQIDNLKKLFDLGIRSLKIEGRLKSADYVFQVCSAYRMVLDSPQQLQKARQLLELDMGREKTSWFLGGKIDGSFTDDITTGMLVGQIVEVKQGRVKFSSNLALKEGYRLRIRTKGDDEPLFLKVEGFSYSGNVYELSTDLYSKISIGDDVILVRIKEQSFSSRLGNVQTLPPLKIKYINKVEVRKGLTVGSTKPQEPRLYVRIGNPDWLPKLRFDDYDAVVLSWSKSDFERFDFQSPGFKQYQGKIWIELPRFISEKQLDFYRTFSAEMTSEGYCQFFISHLSQKLLLPAGVVICSNEHVYVLNDAAARMIQDEKLAAFTYPLENDLDNLLSMANRQGIVPLYYYPELFFSRMPVKLSDEQHFFADESNKKYRKVVKDGVTIVYPAIPVAITHYRKQLEKNGFTRFMIDYSGEIMTANVVKRVLKKFQDGEIIQPSTSFNFKFGLK